MLRRKMLAILLPTVAAVTLVGSGFSAWYFGEKVTGLTNDIDIVITNKVGAVGTLNQFSGKDGVTPTHLILDQGGYKNLINTDAGISFGTSETTPITNGVVGATFTFTNNKTYKNLTSAGMGVFVTQTLKVHKTLLNYVALQNEVEFGNKDDTTDENYVIYTKADDTAVTSDKTYTIDIGTDSDTLKNHLLKYSNKPSTSPLYETMCSNLENLDNLIVFSWSAEVKAL